MSQPPQGRPSDQPDGQPTPGDRPAQGGGWGWQTPQWQPGQGWGQPAAQAGPGWGRPPGPYGQPPPSGEWGAPQRPPGYGEQPTRVGGFGGSSPPPHGPGPTGWGEPGPPGAPGGGGNRKRNAVIAGAVGLLLVVVIAVLLVLGFGGGGGEGTASGGSTGAPSAASTGSSGTTPARPSSAADPADFLGHLPADFTDCASDRLTGDGDVAAASCGAAATQPGPAEATFSRYPDVETLDTAFTDGVASAGLPPLQGNADCSTTTGYGEWLTNGLTGGQVACSITGDGHVLIAWTDEEFLTEGSVRAPGTTQADVSALYDWWTANSFFQE